LWKSGATVSLSHLRVAAYLTPAKGRKKGTLRFSLTLYGPEAPRLYFFICFSARGEIYGCPGEYTTPGFISHSAYMLSLEDIIIICHTSQS